MSEETLFTAARRLVRNLNADFASGLISQDTEAAAHTLQIQIEKQQAANTTPKNQPPLGFVAPPSPNKPSGLLGGAEDLGFLRDGADIEDLGLLREGADAEGL